MPAVVRVGDKCNGHGGTPPPFAPRPCIDGSPSLFVDGLAAHRQGDNWAPHPHPGTLSSGSSNYFAEGKQVGRVGDPISCGSACAEGSGTHSNG